MLPARELATMSSRSIVRVFLGSPGDLGDERIIAKNVVDEFNLLWAAYSGYQIELVGWEDTTATYGRPQEVINRDLDTCELFVGLLWKRWGTESGAYSSGFEEEFRRSVSAKEKSGRPEISILLKKIDDASLRDPGDQLKKVLEFRKELVDGKKILFEEFPSEEHFRAKFSKILTRYVQQLSIADAPDQKLSTRGVDSGSQLAVRPLGLEDEVAANDPVSGFLRQISDRIGPARTGDELSPLESARLRLVAFATGTSKNDSDPLGVHDANIIFSEIPAETVGFWEAAALMRTGLERYHTETVPLWRWYQEVGGEKTDQLQVHTLFGSAQKKSNAIKVLMLADLPPNLAGMERPATVDAWTSDTEEPEVRSAAMKYLEVRGTIGDISFVQRELDRDVSQTRAVASQAWYAILWREDRSAAIDSLIVSQHETLDDATVSMLFSDVDLFTEDQLVALLSHKNATVRIYSTKILLGRDLFSEKYALLLLGDPKAEVRYSAISYLISKGHSYSGVEIKNIINGSSSLLSGDDGATYFYEDYVWTTLSVLSDSDLAVSEKTESVYQMNAFFERYRRNKKLNKKDLVIRLENSFSKEIDDQLLKLAELFGKDHKNVKDIENLVPYIKSGLLRRGLTLLYDAATSADLTTVRKILDGANTVFDAEDAVYLGKFGDWSDADRLLSSVQRPNYAKPMSYRSAERGVNAAAKALVKIAKGKEDQLLVKEMPASLLAKVLEVMPQQSLKSVPDQQILQVLVSKSDEVRKIMSVRVVNNLTKTRVTRLLESYQRLNYRYYNVLHWLDLGVSMPASTVREVTKQALA